MSLWDTRNSHEHQTGLQSGTGPGPIPGTFTDNTIWAETPAHLFGTSVARPKKSRLARQAGSGLLGPGCQSPGELSQPEGGLEGSW